MKILFVIRTLAVGGATKQLTMTANALAERGHDVWVYTFCWAERNEELSDKVKYIPSKTYGKFTEYLHAIPGVRRAVRQVKPTVVISWRANAGFYTRLATMGLNCKVVYSERTDPYMETSVFLKFATWVCNFSEGGVFQTEKARAYYSRLAPKATVIPNPFDCKMMPEIVPLVERNKEIACVGRFFLVQKRQDIMLNSFKLIHEKLPNYHLAFYGDGVDLDKVRQMAKDEGIADFVDFKGCVKDVVNFVKNSRLLVLSSDYEGIPNVVLEAFAAGTPVVTTDCSPGGARVLINDGENGFIVPIRDVESLAKRSVQLILDNELSQKFIARSREKLSMFKYENIADQWNEYINEMCTN